MDLANMNDAANRQMQHTSRVAHDQIVGLMNHFSAGGTFGNLQFRDPAALEGVKGYLATMATAIEHHLEATVYNSPQDFG